MGFLGGILFDFLQNGSQNWAARIYATVGIALSVRELVRTGYGESGCGGGSVVGGLRVVLISTAAGMYDVRQLQLGSAAGSSPGGLSSPTDCCFDAVGDRVFGRFVCVGGVHGLKMVVSLPRHRVFGGESVCRGKGKGDLQMFPAATQSFCPESVCRRGVLGAGCVERGM